MSSPRVTTLLLPPAKGRSICGDSRRADLSRQVSRHGKTGENSRPIIGEDSTPAQTSGPQGIAEAMMASRTAFGLGSSPLIFCRLSSSAAAAVTIGQAKLVPL